MTTTGVGAVDRGRTRTTSPWFVPLMVLAALSVALVAELRGLRSFSPYRTSLFHQTASGWQKLPTPSEYPASLQVSTGGTPWLLTWGHMKRWNGSAWQSYELPDSAGATFAGHEFALDGEQVWVLTRKAVVHWDGRKWNSDTRAAPGPSASIVAGGGDVWMIDANGMLSHYTNGRWQTRVLALPGVKWSAGADRPIFARTSDGTLWLMHAGLWRSDGAAWLPARSAEEMYEAQFIGAAGNVVWFAARDRLYAVSIDARRASSYTYREAGLDAKTWIYGVSQGGSRTCFATSRGLLEFDASKWRMLPPPDAAAPDIRRVAAGPDAMLWIVASPGPPSTRLLRSFLYGIGATCLAILAVGAWIFWRRAQRHRHQHALVTQAVRHATGEVPDELQDGARRLNPTGTVGTAFLWIATIAAYILLRKFWPHAPYWIVVLIVLSVHLIITFTQSLVKRKPQPWDPIGPGGPPRYDWTKSWKSMAGALAVLLLINLDRLPALRFLRGYWLWIIMLVPAFWQVALVTLLNRFVKRADYDGALNMIRWTHFFKPSGIDALRLSGHVLLMAGRYREAEETLRRSLRSSHATESYGLALEYLGDALMEQGRYEEAQRSYEAALHAFPWRRRPYRGMAEMTLRRAENPGLALEYVEKIRDFSGLARWQQIKNGKTQDDYWSLKAWAMARIGHTSEVAEAIANALKDTNHSAAPDLAATQYRAGMALRAQGREVEAKEHFLDAIRVDPHGRRGTLSKAALRETGVWAPVQV